MEIFPFNQNTMKKIKTIGDLLGVTLIEEISKLDSDHRDQYIEDKLFSYYKKYNYLYLSLMFPIFCENSYISSYYSKPKFICSALSILESDFYDISEYTYNFCSNCSRFDNDVNYYKSIPPLEEYINSKLIFSHGITI